LHICHSTSVVIWDVQNRMEAPKLPHSGICVAGLCFGTHSSQILSKILHYRSWCPFAVV